LFCSGDNALMSNIKNIEIEHIEVSEQSNKCSYDVQADVAYSVLDCECDSMAGNQLVTQRWQEVEIDYIDITSYDKFVYNPETELWDVAPSYMPKDSEKAILDKIRDICDTFELED
jgi:hypothetical protein